MTSETCGPTQWLCEHSLMKISERDIMLHSVNSLVQSVGSLREGKARNKNQDLSDSFNTAQNQCSS